MIIINIQKRIIITLFFFYSVISFALAVEKELNPFEIEKLKNTIIQTVQKNEYTFSRFTSEYEEAIPNIKKYRIINSDINLNKLIDNKILLVQFIPGIGRVGMKEGSTDLYFKAFKKNNGDFVVTNCNRNMDDNFSEFNEFAIENVFEVNDRNILDYCSLVSFMTIHPEAGKNVYILINDFDIEKAVNHKLLNYYHDNFKPLIYFNIGTRDINGHHLFASHRFNPFQSNLQEELAEFSKTIRKRLLNKLYKFEYDKSFHVINMFQWFYVVKYYVYSESELEFYEYSYYLVPFGRIFNFKVQKLDTYMYPLTEKEVLKLREDMKKSK